MRGRYLLIWFCALMLSACGGSGLNLFSLDDDKALGLQFDQEIAADPATYPILAEADYPAAYAYLQGIRDEILNAGGVTHRDDFLWEVRLIQDDAVLNAFATPGGYLYFYTGLIKFLDAEDDFAGVMAHEIAHADQRHTTEALTRQYGASLLLDLILGDNQNVLTEIANDLVNLQYSRDNESEADEFSVMYLDPAEYQCDGAASFFEKLIAEDLANSPPEFLSTHPSPENRVEAINQIAQDLQCDITPSGNDYQSFKNMLP